VGLVCFSDFPFRSLLLSVGRLLKRFLYPLRTHIFVSVAVRVCVFYFPIQVAAGDGKMADTVQAEEMKPIKVRLFFQASALLSTLNAKVN
jgi:hypothetical protein